MKAGSAIVALVAMSICSCSFAQTNEKRCVVNRPHAESGQTVAAQMSVVNDGKPCNMHVKFGGGEATSVKVRAQPSNGTLAGTKSPVSYTPNPGFAGKDAFDVQWFGVGHAANYISSNIRTKVEVTVRVKSDEAAD